MTPLHLRLVILAALLTFVFVVLVVTLITRRRGWTPRAQTLDLARLPVRTRAPVQLIAFTSPLCAPCKEVPRLALEAAPEVPLITLDVRDHPDLVRRLGVQTTPSLLLIDDQGRIRWASAELPDPAELWLYVREAWDSTATVRALVAARVHRHPPQR